MKKIHLTKSQYKDLLKTFSLGKMVWESTLEEEGKDWKFLEELESSLLSYAEKFKADDLVEEIDLKEMERVCKTIEGFDMKAAKKDLKGELCLSNELNDEIEGIIDDYNGNNFWEELEIALGKRDFFETITNKEKKELKKTDWLPKRVHEYYEKYRKELEEHGIDRLIIDKKKNVL